MERSECADRLNTLAWQLSHLSESIPTLWDSDARRWLIDSQWVDLAGYIYDLYTAAQIGRIANWLEFNLPDGLLRSDRFGEVLGVCLLEVRAIEHPDPDDPFRWLRESIDTAAQRLPGRLIVTAEHLWELYTKIVEVPQDNEAAALNLSESQTAATEPARISVSLEPPQITIGCNAYALKPKMAELLHSLANCMGEYQSMTESGVKTRDIEGLPREVRAILESQPGAGTRINPEWLI